MEKTLHTPDPPALPKATAFTGLSLLSTNLKMENATLVIRGKTIEYIGETPRHGWKKESPYGEDTLCIDARGFLVTPGFINAHTHLPLAYLRDRAHDRADMIETVFFATEKNLSPELMKPLSYSSIYDGLLSGVTCFVDHYFYIDGIIGALKEFGLKGVVGESLADQAKSFPNRTTWKEAKNTIENWPHGEDFPPIVAPHASNTVSKEQLTDMANFARQHSLPLHYHLSQTAKEYEEVVELHGISPVELAKQCGALGEHSLVVHLTSASEKDLDHIQESGATIGFCPTSQIIYEKLAPIKNIWDRSIPLALGNDCSASNDSMNILQEMKIAALLIKDRLGTKNMKTIAEKVFSMVTDEPARCLNLPKLGKLAVGSSADIVFFQNDLSNQPIVNPLTNMLFSMSSRDVKHVMVNGRWVLWNQNPTLVNKESLHSDYMNAVSEIKKRSSLTP